MLQYFIDGTIGSKKSSLITLLRYKYGIFTVAEPLSQYENMLEKLFDPCTAFESQLQIIVTLNKYQKSEKLKNRSDLVIFERSLESAKFVFVKTMAYFNLLTNEEEKALNEIIERINPVQREDDHLFYFRTSISRSLKLIHLRGRKSEIKYVTEEYQAVLLRFYEEYIEQKKNVTIINVDDLTNKDIAEIILKIVKKPQLPRLQWTPRRNNSNLKRKSKLNYYQNQSVENYLDTSSISNSTDSKPEEDTTEIMIIKKHSLAMLPKISYENDAGYDVFVVKPAIIAANTVEKLDTGIQIRFPKNVYGELHGRSSWPKKGIMVFTGILDTNFYGNIFVNCFNFSNTTITIPADIAIAQIIFKTRLEIDIIEESTIEMKNKIRQLLPQRGMKNCGSSNPKKKHQEEQQLEEYLEDLEQLFQEEKEIITEELEDAAEKDESSNAAEKSEDEQWSETKIAKKPNDLWLFLERKRKKKNKNLKEVEDRLMEEKDKFKMNTKEDQSNEVEELDKSKNSKV